MTILAAILDGALTDHALSQVLAATPWRESATSASGSVGACVRFDGIVRRMEDDEGNGARPLMALDYETYEPMASREFHALAARVCEQHRLHRIAAIHSRGLVRIGETSFVLIVESAHRGEALRALAEFIDALKRDVPIWKHPRWE